MRKLSMLLAALMLCSGLAFAQQQPVPPQQDVAIVVGGAPTSPYWAGINLGYSVGFGLGAHFGVQDLVAPNIDARFRLAFAGSAFGVGADAILPIGVAGADLPLNLYAGGGPALLVGGGAFGFGINAFIGAEYSLGAAFPAGALFAEVGPTIGILPTFGAGLNLTLGFNYYF